MGKVVPRRRDNSLSRVTGGETTFQRFLCKTQLIIYITSEGRFVLGALQHGITFCIQFIPSGYII